MKKQINCSGWLPVVALAFAWFTVQCHAQSVSPVKVRALKDNTNLRAKPALNVEVVGQMSVNQELTVRSMDTKWVEVIAPTNIDFWVLDDYLKDGLVVCRQTVNVRAGPGINFSIVGQLTNGVKVEVRGSHMDWIKIAPPEGCSLWVSRPLVEIAPAVPVKAQPVKLPAAVSALSIGKGGESQVRDEAKTAVRKPPTDLDLIPDVVQGQWKQFEGVLKMKNFLVRSPSDFRLVAYDKGGRPRTICFVKGNRAQLDVLLYRELIISGRQYWVHRQRYPVLVPEKIILK